VQATDDLGRGLLSSFAGQEIYHRWTEQRRVARVRRKGRSAALSEPASDRGTGMLGLTGEPTCTALHQPCPPELEADADRRPGLAQLEVVLGNDPPRVQGRRGQAQHLA